MNVFRSVLHSVLALSVAAAAVPASAKTKTLDEFMSPDELLKEIGVPNNTWEWSQVDSGLPPRIEILVDKQKGGSTPTAQRMFVYLDGQLLWKWKVSTGRETQENSTKSGRKYFSSTNLGTFKFHYRTVLHHSTLWDADMPFAQFFDGGIAIHATTPSHYAELGSRASGGCVRLKHENAEKLYRLVNCIGSAESAVTVLQSKKNELAPPMELASRVMELPVNGPQFQLDCQTFQDSLVLDDGRVIACKNTRKDYDWETRECGIKKSVALANGGMTAIPDDESKRAAEEQRRLEEEQRKREEESYKKVKEQYERQLREHQRNVEEARKRQEAYRRACEDYYRQTGIRCPGL